MIGRPKPLCHVVLSGYDFERIGAALRYFRASKVYVVENGNPLPQHVVVRDDVHEKLFNFIKKMNYEEGKDLFSYKVNFYDIGEAMVQLYELFRREQKEGYDVIVNICSGTKPVVIAAAWAAALAKCNIIYFSAESYERTSTCEVVAKGVIPSPIYFGPIFDIAEAMLQFTDKEKEILLRLHKRQAKTIKEIVGESASKRDVAKYAYYLKKLEKRKLVEVTRGKISLTELGRLIARLLEIEIGT
jgi:predicted methyltransferase